MAIQLSDIEKKVAGIRADRAEVSREGRLADHMESLNNELDRQHQARMGARARRLESALAAGADGGRYSPITMDRMRGELEYMRGGGITGLRQHELDVLKQQGENAIGVEREKAEGLKNQGLSAAERNLEATKYGADKNLEIEQERQRGMTEREKSIAEGNLNVEKERRAGALDLERARQRGALSIAQEQSGGAVDLQVEKNKGLQAQADIERNAKEFEMQHQKELTQMRINGQLPNRQEMSLLYQIQQKPENKDKSIAELLDQIRGTSRY